MKKLSALILFLLSINCYSDTIVLSEKEDLFSSAYCLPVQVPDTVKSRKLVAVDSFDVNIVPPSSGVQLYKDGIIFLSGSRNYSRMVPVHISFGNIQAYYAVLKDSVLVNPRVFPVSPSFNYPCDALTFNKEFTTMYFTKRSEKDPAEKIYQANYSQPGKNTGTWKVGTTPLEFCTGNFVYTHPTVSMDGNMMIFSSDRPGSQGGFDLFLTRRSGDKWSDPENLGSIINTKSNEMFPSLDSANNLYFSSDGHPGFGGYDIYVCRFTGKGWEEPYNLTNIINTPGDEVALTLDRQKGRFGFYTSTDKPNNPQKQLYKINFENLKAPDNISNVSVALQNIAYSDLTFPHKKLIAEIVMPEVKKEEIKKPEERKEVTPPPEVKKEEVKQPAIKAEEFKAPEIIKEEVKPLEIKDIKLDTIQVITQVREELRDVVVYRVQILSSAKQMASRKVVVDGKSYDTYVYFYKKEYRHTVGEFTNLEEARQLQFALRKTGYPQAFVAAFRNNTRTLDLTLFTRIAQPQAPVIAREEPKPEVRKEEARLPEIKKEEPGPAEVKKEEIKQPEPRKARVDTVKVITEVREELRDVIVYRVQFLSSTKQQNIPSLTVNGRQYSTYIYFYLKEYRYTVGEFTTLEPARELQSAMRKLGYPQAFVAAFRNNVRSLDITLFR
ncbi:MAG TPA: SPOR domain-containing protein, partial [Bacteroidales bacterium]|jgi:hypothetical protein|nr:hypothetical protein [Bacteroidales bacterium]OQB63336.1 MAG: WD40-like Beta Propeller Repeat protein [Bacteroidetes bacterium ADurb.Bin145]HOU01768.1 SPOR domain-containing protein [Bacteroidales bacterium]HQG62776.1 SPOR domain-containing protein [Bacteroidales bacterium]HQK68175.1 SPOR domain-containing protein [Bacteroidales bacterium]